MTDRRKIRNEAIMQALENFPQVLGERRHEVYIDRDSADLTFDAGERGSGKSWNLRGRTNRGAEAGVTTVLIDPENEYYTNNIYNGIQKKLANLRDREEPHPIDTKVLMSNCVYKARQQKNMPENGYDHMEVFTFGFQDLRPDDLHFLITRQFDSNHPDFYTFVSEIEDRLRGGDRIRSWDDIKAIAHQLQEEGDFEYTHRARRIEQVIERNYEKWGFLGARKKIDLKQVFTEYDCIALSLHDGDYLPEDTRMKELIVAFLIRRVRNLVERGEIPKPIDWVVDEAHNYIPSDTEPEYPPSKAEIRQAIKEDRKRGFRVSMASQEPTDVQGKNFLNQTRHFFLPQNIKPGPRQHLLRKAGVKKAGDEGRDKWGRIFEAMKNQFDYAWLYVDAKTENWMVLEIPSPLAYHRTEDG